MTTKLTRGERPESVCTPERMRQWQADKSRAVGHKVGLTRRDLLSHGFFSAAAMLLMPSVPFFWSKEARAADCGGGTSANTLPFMTFDMAGGAVLAGNALVGKPGGAHDLLRAYDLLGWDPRASGALDERFGARPERLLAALAWPMLADPTRGDHRRGGGRARLPACRRGSCPRAPRRRPCRTSRRAACCCRRAAAIGRVGSFDHRRGIDGMSNVAAAESRSRGQEITATQSRPCGRLPCSSLRPTVESAPGAGSWTSGLLVMTVLRWLYGWNVQRLTSASRLDATCVHMARNSLLRPCGVVRRDRPSARDRRGEHCLCPSVSVGAQPEELRVACVTAVRMSASASTRRRLREVDRLVGAPIGRPWQRGLGRDERAAERAAQLDRAEHGGDENSSTVPAFGKRDFTF